MFRTCHVLVLKNRPFEDFKWICELDEAKGVELLTSYRTPSYCKVFVKSIVEVEYFHVKESMKEAKFLYVIGDGSTDSSIKEQDMWFCRTCVQGNISVKFIGAHSPEKTNAEGILAGLKETVQTNLQIEWPEFSGKLAALACDGASVMVGARAGVGALLREDSPSMITIHCIVHRLEMCLKDSTKKIKLYERSTSILAMGIYYFYHNSALNRSMLRRSFSALNEQTHTGKTLLMPTRVEGKRWIGHTFRALTNLLASYKFIVTHLGQLTEPTERVSVDSKSKAVTFLRLLRCKEVICFLHFMLDILAPLKRMSKLLQEKTYVLAKQHSEIATTLEVLRKYQNENGPHLRKVAGVDEYLGTELTRCGASEFQSVKVKLLKQIEEALERRFGELNSTQPNSSIVHSTKIAHIQSWPKTWKDLRVYGDTDVQVLLDHFRGLLESAGVDVAQAELEWMLLKKAVFDDYLKQKKGPPEWNDLQSAHLQHILAVIDLILTMAPSSAEAERGFSQLKLIKSDLRSTLGQTSLNHCLGIKKLADGISEFDPVPAIEHWNGCGIRSRRPLFKVKRSRQNKPHTYEMAPVESD